jgi:hypothetical protein
MDEFEKIIWLGKLETLKEEAEDSDISELAYLFSVICTSVKNGQLSKLQEQFSVFLIEEIEKTQERLRTLHGIQEIEKINEFLYNEDDDDHFPFNDDSDLDTNA